MKIARGIYCITLRLAPAVLAAGLIFAATASQAVANYGGYGYGGPRYGYGGYSHGYGGYRYGYGGPRYGYGGYRYGYGGPRYGYGGYRYGSYYGGRYSGSYYGGGYGSHGRGYGLGDALYGVLSIPAHIAGAIFGRHPHDGGHAPDSVSIPPATPRAAAPDGSGDYTGSSGATDNGGWSRLAEGRFSQALAIFAYEASSRPTEGRLKVGYALSAAAGGDLGRGVWAMRRALRIDPEAVNYLTMDSIDEALRPRVEAIIASYVEDPYEILDDVEATFMLASLYYLLGESESARNAIKVAIAGDDTLPSTANLKHLIDLAPADDGAALATEGRPPGDDY